MVLGREDDETWNEPMRQAYQKEIAKIEGEEIDYAFFPLIPDREKRLYLVSIIL